MQWNSDAIAKLFVAVLKISEVKIDYVAVAKAMGEDCTPKAITHQISKLKNMNFEANAASAPDGDETPSTPAKGTKRGRTATPKTAGKKTPTPKAKAAAKVSTPAAANHEDGSEDTDQGEEVETPAKKIKTEKLDADGGEESAANSASTTKAKAKAAKGEPHKLTANMAKYNTDHYNLYDHEEPNDITAKEGTFTKFADYDDYELYINATLDDVSTIPTAGVRIDDLTISRVLTKFTHAKLTANWPADIDKQGMPRPTRAPLGLAAKVWVSAGEADVEGNVVEEGHQGYYYRWWKGLHCLMGKEGMDSGLFVQRPTGEAPLCKGFGFKVGFRAVVQEAEGGFAKDEDEDVVTGEVRDEEILGEEEDEGVAVKGEEEGEVAV